MGSKYDAFWRARTETVAELMDRAAAGEAAEMDVSGIRHLGNRGSWYGIARLRADGTVDGQMAHMVALARLLLGTGLPSRHRDREFILRMSSDGARLAVHVASAGLGGGEVSVVPGDESLKPTLAPVNLRGPIGSGHVDPADACAVIHRVLESLPLLSDPSEVKFSDGLYFFYEDGEASSHATEGRVVRVGNHPRREHGLVLRLQNHYATRPNAKNGSVFCRYLGGALLRRDDPASPCLAPAPGAGHWEHQDGLVCPRCEDYERRVSEELRLRFRFRCIEVTDQEERNELEKRLIGTLARCAVCTPTPRWLGRFSYRETVRGSGLWNDHHVENPPLDGEGLARFVDLVSRTPGPRVPGDVRSTLLLIPCSGGKRGQGNIALPERGVADFLGPETANLLKQGRERAFSRRGNWIDTSSALWPAVGRYSGRPYKAPGVMDLLIEYIKEGGHCLIVSGGYGLVRPEEPIHIYQAPMNRTADVWRQRLPLVMADYVAQAGITRTFGVFSRAYASVVPNELSGEDWRAVPEGEGMSAINSVPQEVGRLLASLLASNLLPGNGWRRA